MEKKTFRQVLHISGEFTMVILLGLLVYTLDILEFRDAYIKMLIVTFALFKCVFFIHSIYQRIVKFSKEDIAYHHFIVFFGITLLLVVVSFALDYFCLYHVHPEAFSNFHRNTSLGYALFESFYFSLLIFTNIGIAKIIPESPIAELLVMMEAVLSFMAIIFILSDFVSLKEALSRAMGKKR